MKVLILAAVLLLAVVSVVIGQSTEAVETTAGDVAVEIEAEAAVAVETVEEPAPIDAYAEANDIMLHLCMECHGDFGHDAGFKLPTTREGTGIVGVPSIQRTDLMLIDPGHPETSYFNMKLKADPGMLGKQMPIAQLLSDEQIAMFDLWVTELGEPYAEPVEESEAAVEGEKPEKAADCDDDGDEDDDSDADEDDDDDADVGADDDE